MQLSRHAIPLTSGAYEAHSLIADAQRCVNLFPEINPQETKPAAPVTHYPRPGLRALVAPSTAGRGRGVFALSNGNIIAVVGQNVYYVSPNWVLTLLGQIGNALTPVSIIDNGVTAVIVDNSGFGYTFTIATNTWNGQLNDPTGLFVGATRADYVDTFLTFNKPGTNQWYISLPGTVTFNALNIAAKSSYPDPIQTQIVNLRQVWLLGTQTSEVWYLSGAASFPFEEWPNIFIPYGCIAPYSAARADMNVFWLAQNKDGKRMAVMTEGYGVEAISTRALEAEWNDYPDCSDAIGYSYQQSGHTYYNLHFPGADKSYSYDKSTKQWSQPAWIDNNGTIHRERVAFHAFGQAKYGYQDTNIGQDWATGQLYAIDQNVYTDAGQPIVRIRSFPHFVAGMKEVTHAQFVADIDTGNIPGTGEDTQTLNPWSSGFSSGFGPLIQEGPPMICMRYSNTGGATWSNYRPKRFLSAGHYRTLMRWPGLGMARDRVYELAWAINGKVALQGGYIDPLVHGQ